MTSLSSWLLLAHMVGLALGVGAATAKLALLLRCRADPTRLPSYLQVAAPLTRQIVLGLVLLTLSGIGWLLLGYPWTPVLVVKLALVLAIWLLGPIIDKVAEPAFRRLAPASGEPASPAFLQAQRRYLAVEATATGLFYAVIVVWTLF